MTGETTRSLALRLVDEEMSARRYGERSRAMVRSALADFLRWASRRGTGDVLKIGKKDLASYQGHLCGLRSKRTGEPLAASTINGLFGAVVLLFSCLYRSELIRENPVHGLDRTIRKPERWKRRPLTREEITKFLDSLDTETRIGQRDRSLFELIYSSGLRVSEAARLKIGDIDFERRVMIVRGKRDRDRMVPISQVALDFLSLYLINRYDALDEWVFPGYKGHLSTAHISQEFREILRRLDMDRKDISTHSIRHSTATHLLENGASVRHVQELLGHASIESTVRYTHVMTEGLYKVYRKHHPREHELYEEVDAEYGRKLAAMIAGSEEAR